MSNLMVKQSDGRYTPADQEQIISAAYRVLESKWLPKGAKLTCPTRVREYLTMHLSEKEHEVFCVLFLDSQHRAISFDEMFQGTIDSASVYPREVVKRALQHNAGAVILAHNHPSGDPEPSAADRRITTRLVEALGLIECRVLDHFIVGRQPAYSFAEHGLL
ncbi:JAB domain-containing protein [Pistricoccus aurantiacus]|nr:DNA repair protein RadC [Pistricoccus aurantiacus]